MYRKFAIAIPTYNELENIKALIPTLKTRYPYIKIFVIDDNSPDGTAGTVEKLATQFSSVFLIKRWQKSGLASAYLDAFNKILQDPEIDYIITMDADFSHSPEDLKTLLDAAINYGLVVGSRYIAGGKIENWNFRRRILSKFGNYYAKLITGVPVNDLTAGFVIYNRQILEKILESGVRSEGYAYQIEMKYLAYKHRAKIKEIPITFGERTTGKSKLSNGVVVEGIIMPWYLRLFR